jgi:hypothetical protein
MRLGPPGSVKFKIRAVGSGFSKDKGVFPMKLTTKLVIGSALAVASMHAFAQVAVPPPPYSPTSPLPTTGNGGALLTLFSQNDGTPFSYEFNLGLSFNDLLPSNGMNTPGTTLVWNLNDPTIPANLRMSSVIPAGVATSDLIWHVTAASNTGSINTAGAFKLEATADPTVPASQVQATTSGALSAANGQDNSYLTNINAVPAPNNTNPHTTQVTSDPTYANGFYNRVLNHLLYNVGAGTSATENFFLLTSARGAVSQIQPLVQYAGTWALNIAAGTLTYSVGGSSVPLPAAVWLLLSGLAGMGVVGRRKAAATSVAA